MQTQKKGNFFYYLAFMVMASAYLPLVFNNLPTGIRSHHLYAILWVISVLFSKPKVFVTKPMKYIILYSIFIVIALHTIWANIDDWNYKFILEEIYAIIIGASVYTYFMRQGDYESIAKLTKWTLVFFFITGIMSIVSSAIDPMYARNIISIGNAKKYEVEEMLSFKKYGGGGWQTAGIFMCLFPMLIYYYKNNRYSLLTKRNIIIFAIVLFFALLGMQIFANLIISIVFSFIAILGMRKISRSIFFIVSFVLILFVTPQSVYISGLKVMGEFMGSNAELKFKLTDLAVFMETGSSLEDNSTAAGGRASRYPALLETFSQSPLGGCFFLTDGSGYGYDPLGAHIYWMNRLAVFGLIMFFVFFAIPYNFIKMNNLLYDKNYRFYYTVACVAFLAIGFMKIVGGREGWYGFFIVLPGMYYLPMLKKKIN